MSNVPPSASSDPLAVRAVTLIEAHMHQCELDKKEAAEQRRTDLEITQAAFRRVHERLDQAAEDRSAQFEKAAEAQQRSLELTKKARWETRVLCITVVLTLFTAVFGPGLAKHFGG